MRGAPAVCFVRAFRVQAGQPDGPRLVGAPFARQGAGKNKTCSQRVRRFLVHGPPVGGAGADTGGQAVQIIEDDGEDAPVLARADAGKGSPYQARACSGLFRSSRLRA